MLPAAVLAPTEKNDFCIIDITPDAMMLVKQPQTPVLKAVAEKHLATFRKYAPPTPMQ